jgi:hypothetical protein
MVPEMVAAGAASIVRMRAPAMPAQNHVNDRMASSRGFSRFWLGGL